MIIPVFYKIEAIDPQKLQNVYMGKISVKETDALKESMGKKYRRSLTALIVCASIFAVCAVLGIFHEFFDLGDGIALFLLPGIFLSFLIGIFQLNSFAISLICLDALKCCRPGSVWRGHPLYKLNRHNQELLSQIAANKFTAAEAYGIQNMAEAARVGNIFFTLLAVAMACLAVFLIYKVPGFMPAFGHSMRFFPPLFGSLFALIAVLRLSFIGHNNKYINHIKTYYSKEREERINAGVNAMIYEIKQKTTVPAVTLTAKRQETTVFSSKLGGMPYLPPGFSYPTRKESGTPLRLLAQLNFDELPKITGFPDRGILQFFAVDDDMYGMDFDNPASQNGFRVIYHEDVVRDTACLGKPPRFDDEDTLFPFEGEFALHGKIEEMPMSFADFRFRELVLALYNRIFSENEKNLYNLPDDTYETLCEAFEGGGHRFGGYPFFTQEDPRDNENKLAQHTILLLQIDSEDEIMWGDSGVANFFISPEKLQMLDFSDVIYNWDCY